MPRRNNRRKPPARVIYEDPRPLTTEGMALSLVRRGLASEMILDTRWMGRRTRDDAA